MAKVGKSVAETLITLFRPYPKAGLFAYKGEIGLLLLSKYPITDSRIIDFKKGSTLNHRASIRAIVTTPRSGSNLIYCTHLTAKMNSNVPYTGINGSWEHENYLQAEAIISDSYSVLEVPTYAMGDFNCSFKNDGISDELSDNCQLFINSGFKDPLSTDNKKCTFCTKNSLNDAKKDLIIDHIFTKNTDIISTSVTKEEKVEISTKDGTKLQINLSDHFGVRIKTEDRLL